MNFDGQELSTIGEMSDVILAITRNDDYDAAQRFMTEYRRVNEHADDNVGYMSGYYDPETMAKVQRLFDVAHPIFGRRTDVSPGEAFQAGTAFVEKLRTEDVVREIQEVARQARDEERKRDH